MPVEKKRYYNTFQHLGVNMPLKKLCRDERNAALTFISSHLHATKPAS